jgi:surface antigen
MKPVRLSSPAIRRAAVLALLGLTGLSSGPAHAVRGYDNFSNTPVAKFSKEDSALMMTRVNQALKAEKDGETLEWKSEASPASGSVTPLARFSADGVACRRLRIVNVYGELKAQGVYRFCEKGAGKWKLVGPDAAPA